MHTSQRGIVATTVPNVYNDSGQLVTEHQEHGGAVDTGTSLKVEYFYADGSSNTIRLTKMTYPDGRELNYDYGSTGSTDDALSRVASLIDDDGTTHLVDYSYLGRNTFVQTDYPEPDLRYDLAMGAGDDPYGGFDRFGRIVDSRWYDYGSSADVDRILYGYDRASNRTYREQTCDSNSYHDEVYGYDGVNRLTDFDRGVINANKDAISTLKFAQQWSLDPTGNWSAFKEDDDGDSTWDLEQTRTSNAVNEITDITETSGPSWVTPVYSRAGNMTTIPKPADQTSSFAATYDAWNRLVKLEEGANTVAEYVYDGVKRRIVQKSYTSGTLSETRSFHYSPRWQVIEERVGAIVDMQFVWGRRYIDEIVLRDRDGDSDGVMDERRYALQDANWNVTALADNNGDVQERYAYIAYGKRQVLSPTFATASSSECDWQIQFAGYRYDAATGLYHVRHRMYQAELACWVQRDPVGYRSDTQTLYRYVRNTPLLSSDPFGLEKVDPAPLRCEDCTIHVLIGHTSWVRPILTDHRQEKRKHGPNSKCKLGAIACQNKRIEGLIPEDEQIVDAPGTWLPVLKIQLFGIANELLDAAIKDAAYYSSWCCDCKQIKIRTICQPDVADFIQRNGSDVSIPRLSTTGDKLCGDAKVDTEWERKRPGWYTDSPWYVGEFAMDCAKLSKIKPRQWHDGSWKSLVAFHLKVKTNDSGDEAED